MKPKTRPNSHETLVPEDAFMVTKTDPEGHICYASRLCCEISGYHETELLGEPHNIIRHPDMPQSLFHLLWDTLKSGQEFNAILKNLRQDGGYYWTFTNISPSTSGDGKLVGYYSVHRKPTRHAITVIQKLYQEMRAAEANSGKGNAIAAATKVLNTQLESCGISYDQFILTL